MMQLHAELLSAVLARDAPVATCVPAHGQHDDSRALQKAQHRVNLSNVPCTSLSTVPRRSLSAVPAAPRCCCISCVQGSL